MALSEGQVGGVDQLTQGLFVTGDPLCENAEGTVSRLSHVPGASSSACFPRKTPSQLTLADLCLPLVPLSCMNQGT